MTGSINAEWIAVDWGTTRLRAFAMGAGGSVLASAASDDGMGGLSQKDFEPALLKLIQPWLHKERTEVIACGMVGARQGWVEAPYRAVPCPVNVGIPIVAPSESASIRVHIIPGVMQQEPPDVMRGEETQIAGYLAGNPDFDGILCLPGTHTKWVHISAGEIVSFRTFMSGELFGLLAEFSVLRHSVAENGWDQDAFGVAVSDALSRPEQMAAKLFSLRAASLVSDQSGATGRAMLSGLLIGAELAAARPYWLGQDVVLIGADQLVANYQIALRSQGMDASTADAAKMSLAGLTAAYNELTLTI